MSDSVFKIPHKTIEFKTINIYGKKHWKVFLHHCDIRDGWTFYDLEEAQNAVQVMKDNHPDAEYIETDEGT